MIRRSLLLATLLLVPMFGIAQTPSRKPPHISATARLTAAKTVYLKNAGGNEMPFNVISEGVQGWGRYTIVNDPEKADLIVEVMSPNVGRGISISSTNSTPDPHTGVPAESVTSTKEMTVSRITLIIYDARSKAALWSASEQPNGALRDKTRKDNVVESAQHLVTKFRERVEPEAK
jgi:hypothetical protein